MDTAAVGLPWIGLGFTTNTIFIRAKGGLLIKRYVFVFCLAAPIIVGQSSFAQSTVIPTSYPTVKQQNPEQPMPPKQLSPEILASEVVPLYQDAILTLLRPYIEKEINNHYLKTLKHPPIFAPYYGTQLQIRRVEGKQYTFLVNVHVTPYVGAHIAVGEDDIVFEINGTVKTKNFIHQKDYKLPPYLSNYYR